MWKIQTFHDALLIGVKKPRGGILGVYCCRATDIKIIIAYSSAQVHHSGEKCRIFLLVDNEERKYDDCH
jgi:hypothetical protein